MKIEDIIVKITLADNEQKEKGILAFAVIRIPLDFDGFGRKYEVGKGFIVWGNSEYPDGIKGYCSVTPPSKVIAGRKPLRFIFIENENFKEDKEFWREFSKHILRAYYKKIGPL